MTALEQIISFTGKEFKESRSPFMHWFKPIVIKAEEGKLELQYSIRTEWLNPLGNLHDGITAAIIDNTIGATVITLNDPDFFSTINTSIDYLSSAKGNEKIIAKTHIIKEGKLLISLKCEIWNSNKTRLIALGTSNLFRTVAKIKQ
ncbi:PaaI family thioesterase [Flavobacterium sp. ARAG 55.4]|uniref:PaaI family thioesterase n=1 Tax=Flavobacterium sp. ARAG 55.4 TaxID=3451357 RepID=UPI003F48B4C3